MWWNARACTTFEMKSIDSGSLGVSSHTGSGNGSCDTYLLGGDHDTNLLDGFGELVWLHDTIIVEIKVFERLEQNLLLGLGSACFL